MPHAPDSRTGDRHVASERVAEFHLLGRLDFDEALTLQRRLVYEVAGQHDDHMVVLLCEHSELITVGRNGSRRHVRLTGEQLGRQGLRMRWVKRGGGCVLHAPGQLAVYPIVSLTACGWSVGEFLRRFQQGIGEALSSLNISTQQREGSFGIWGRSGLIAAMGVAVQHETTCQGAFVNVHPAMSTFRYVDTVVADSPSGNKTMTSLLAERRLPIRMQTVRSAVIDSLVGALGCQRHHIHSGHPWLRRRTGDTSGNVARAS